MIMTHPHFVSTMARIISEEPTLQCFGSIERRKEKPFGNLPTKGHKFATVGQIFRSDCLSEIVYRVEVKCYY